MTKKGFWRKLESISKEFQNDPKMGNLRFPPVLRQAYEEDLWLPCGVRHSAPDLLNQLYISSDPASTESPGCRWMLCYTSPNAASENTALPEPWEELPVRFIIDNAMSKPSIGGLLFNNHRPNHFFIVPKELLNPNQSYFNAIKDMMSNPPSYNT